MASLSKISQMSRYEQMEYYRNRRKEAYAQIQTFSSIANGMMSIKSSEAREMGNIAAKIASQRISKKA